MPAKKTVGWAQGFEPPTPEASQAACGFGAEPIPAEYDAARAAGLFRPVPAPTHIDDWLAQFEEDEETYPVWRKYCKRRLPSKPKGIAIVPIGDFRQGPSLEVLRRFTEIYFDGLPVTLRTAIDVARDGAACHAVPPGGGAPRRKLVSRTAHRYDRERPDFIGHDHTQLKVGPLLGLLADCRPTDVHCLVGVTMYDLYDDHTDSFSVGMAAGGSGVGVFSFCRYAPGFSLFRAPRRAVPTGAAAAALLLQRCCKTLVHEIAHTYYVGHCVFYDCIMRGSGHLAEDFAIPMHLCPVDLRKFQFVCKFDVVGRYQKLRHFYETYGMAAEAQWVRARLQQLRPDDGPAAPLLPCPAAEAGSAADTPKRKRSGSPGGTPAADGSPQPKRRRCSGGGRSSAIVVD